MVRKILKTLTNNIGFKLLAVFMAFILWLVVYNIDDPVKTNTYTVRVNVINAEAVTDQNKCYQALDGTNNVTFSVSAPRSVMEKVESGDFTATADMNQMVVDETGTVATVPITISAERYNSSLTYNGGTKFFKVSLEDLMTKTVGVTAQVEGEVANGYAIGEVSAITPNVISVSGPASIVSNIDNTAVATINVEGMAMNLSGSVVPVLYDKEGNEVDTTRLTISSSTVTVSVNILATKEVDLIFATTGALAPNRYIVNISSDPAKVHLKGSSSVLNTITALEIPDINVGGASADFEKEVYVSEYLPDGVELVDASEDKVKIKVEIEPYEYRTFTIESENIEVAGLGEEYNLSWLKNSVNVSIGGLASDLDKLTNAALLGTVDVSGISEGTYTMTVQLALDEEIYSVGKAQISLLITAKTSLDTDNDTQGNTTGGSSNDGTTNNGTTNNGSSDNGSTNDDQNNEDQDLVDQNGSESTGSETSGE